MSLRDDVLQRYSDRADITHHSVLLGLHGALVDADTSGCVAWHHPGRVCFTVVNYQVLAARINQLELSYGPAQHPNDYVVNPAGGQAGQWTAFMLIQQMEQMCQHFDEDGEAILIKHGRDELERSNTYELNFFYGMDDDDGAEEE